MPFPTKTATRLILSAAFSVLAGAAFATDTAQAIKICDANPNCKHYQDGIKIVLTVKNDDGVHQVECPSIDGECSVVMHSGVKRNVRADAILSAGRRPTATISGETLTEAKPVSE